MYSQRRSYYRPQPQQSPARHHPWRKWRSIGMLFIVAFAGYLIFHRFSVRTAAVTQPVSFAKQQSDLTKTLNELAAYNHYKIGIAITDLHSGQTITAGSTDSFAAASTAKLFTASAYYHMVETNQASLDQQVGSWPASFQLHEMINDSDNDSWDALEALVTDDGLTRYMRDIATPFNLTDNQITPSTMSKFLAKLYKNQLLTAEDTKSLLSDMQNTNMEQMIPAVVPSSLTVYHKYGLLNGALNDVGIITDDSHSYSLAIYTQNADDSDDLARIRVIRQITADAIHSLFPGVTPLTPAAPTEVDD